MKLLRWCKANAMPVIAVLAAAVTAVFVPPDAAYLGYYDVKTLSCLLCVLAVVGALRRVGLFPLLAQRLVQVFHNTRGAVTALVGITLVGSMLLTNDTALLTFLPLSWFVLERTGQTKWTALTFILQNCAANLGGMLTPFGNPQNLYLYAQSGRGLGDFLALMLPYTLLSGLMLLLCLLPGRSAPLAGLAPGGAEPSLRRRRTGMYLLLFLASVSSVAKLLPVWLLTAAVVVCVLAADRRVLRRVDWSLLLTFAAFFVFIGNMGRVPAFRSLLEQAISGHELVTAVCASQVISNVPAALLLSGFTSEWDALIVGTNLGGLGTLIASMASLISYKFFVREHPQKRGAYLLFFTGANLLFLAVLLPAALLLG